MERTATVLLLPQDSNKQPLWNEAKAIAISMGADVFDLIMDADRITRGCVIVFNERVYIRSSVKPTLDLSGDDVTYAIYVTEVSDPRENQSNEIDVDATGKPVFKLIQGGKSNG